MINDMIFHVVFVGIEFSRGYGNENKFGIRGAKTIEIKILMNFG